MAAEPEFVAQSLHLGALRREFAAKQRRRLPQRVLQHCMAAGGL